MVVALVVRRAVIVEVGANCRGGDAAGGGGIDGVVAVM